MNIEKRGLFFAFTFVFSILILSGFVSAATMSGAEIATKVNEFIDYVVQIAKPIVVLIIGNTDDGQLLFAKLLIFFLVLALVNFALTRITALNDHPWALWTISLVIPLMAVRFITDVNWIRAAIMPSTVLGVAFVAIIPMVICFYFIENMVPTPTFRKISWIFVAVVFGGMFFTFYNDFNSSQYVGGVSPVWIYPIAAVLSIIFLFADKTIQSAFASSRTENIVSMQASEERRDLLREFKLLKDDLNVHKTITTAQFTTDKATLKKRATALGFADLAKMFS